MVRLSVAIGLTFILSLSCAQGSTGSEPTPLRATHPTSDETSQLLSDLRTIRKTLEEQLQEYDRTLQLVLYGADTANRAPADKRTLLVREKELAKSGFTSTEVVYGRSRALTLDLPVADLHLRSAAELLWHILKKLDDPTAEPKQRQVLAYTAKQIIINSYLIAGMVDMKVSREAHPPRYYLPAVGAFWTSVLVHPLDSSIAIGVGGLSCVLGVASWIASCPEELLRPRRWWSNPAHFANIRSASDKLIERFWDRVPGARALSQERLKVTLETLNSHHVGETTVNHCEAFFTTSQSLRNYLQDSDLTQN